MATAAENLQTAVNNACARLAELDAVSFEERPTMTFQDGGRTFSFNEYRAALVSQIAQTRELLIAVQASAGPFQVHVPPGW